MFVRFPGGRTKALTLSYDDGVIEDKRLLALMEAHGVKGTFNLNSGLFEPEGVQHPAGSGHYRMTEAECRALYQSECAEVAAHALTHAFLDCIPTPAVQRELIVDRENLERMTGKLVRGFAYPNGRLSDSVVEQLCTAGFAYARTVISTERFDLPTDPLRLAATCHHNNPRLPELTERFLALDPNGLPSHADRNAQLFYLWGHAYEFFDNQNWDVIERFFDRIAGKEDIWYATNIEVFDYLEAYRRLRCSADMTICMNPSAIDVWVFHNEETVRIPAGLAVRF